MIPLIQIDGNVIDLSICPEFVKHYENTSSFAKHILEYEINTGLWYDDILFNLQHNSIIIDAGANVGLWSLYISPRAQKIYCIEPTNSHIFVLINLIKKFNLPIIVFDAAISNKNGYCGIETNKFNSTMNKIGDGGNKQCFKLANILKQTGNVDLLKLDIESAEHEVILEDETIGEALSKCKIVYIETHPEPYGHADEKAIIQKMISLGFTHKRGAREMSHYFIQ